jgi:hypothetical protein
MTEKQIKYLRILQQQLTKGVIKKKYYKKEVQAIRNKQKND